MLKFLSKIKLNSPFIIVQIGTYGFFIPAILFPYFFPQYFLWISDIKLYVIVSIIFLVFNTILSFFYIFSKSKINQAFKYVGSLWTLWYFFFILITGGVNSSFAFLLLIVVIISMSFLDLSLTKNVCIFTSILISLTIFFSENKFSLSNISLHVVHVFGYIIIVWYIYKFTKNVLYQKYQEEDAKRRFAELSEIDNVKKIFITAMSHQLRTPLTNTKLALEIIIKNNKIDKKLLETSYEGVKKSIEIIGDILETATYDINVGSIKIKKDLIHLDKLLNNAVSGLNYLSENKKVGIAYKKMQNISVLGDEKILSTAITAVLDNSIKYSPGGNVEISLEQIGNQAKITIKDSGIGIDPVDMEYMFQKFYRGKNAMLLEPNQSGIGLYTAKKILELHDGSITISSQLKKGTTVEITLPIGKF